MIFVKIPRKDHKVRLRRIAEAAKTAYLKLFVPLLLPVFAVL